MTKKFSWEKKGLIIKPLKKGLWKTHAMIPTPEKISKNIYRIYFSGRNEKNQSLIYWANVDLTNFAKVINYSKKPILTPGPLGCFDDNGVTPSCVLNLNKRIKAMYYIGWNPGSTTRMNIFGGLAISKNNGKKFQRWSNSPIIERTKVDPYINTAPWVIKISSRKYFMYYVSGKKWINKDKPVYNIKIAKSEDGYFWKREGKVVMDFGSKNEIALARPYVFFDENKFKMIFSCKGANYKLAYAESKDGLIWHRNDKILNFSKSKKGFDNQMTEYAIILKSNKKYHMFYNGNNYGYDGIGYAVSSK